MYLKHMYLKLLIESDYFIKFYYPLIAEIAQLGER